MEHGDRFPEIDDEFLDEINFDTLFDNIGCDFNLFDDDFNLPPVTEHQTQNPSPSGSTSSSWVGQIEELLMNEDEAYGNPNQDFSLDYFSDLLTDVGGVGQARVLNDDEKSTPDSNVTHEEKQEFNETQKEVEEIKVLSDDEKSSPVLTGTQKQVEEIRVLSENSTLELDVSDDSQEKEGNDSSEGKNQDNGENDDPVSKKRKRQLRNKDAAVRSRERKKLYVRDLEMKSRYLEGECIRLQRLLQCCYADNHALHLQLQMGKGVHGVSRTKQESAVLLLESLPLGSLLWFLGIMVLCLLLPLLHTILPAAMLAKVASNNQEIGDLATPRRVESEKRMGLGTLRLFFKRKRCKATRSKMKDILVSAVLA